MASGPAEGPAADPAIKPKQTLEQGVEAERASGVLERLRRLFQSTKPQDALAQALQNGDGVAAGLSKSRRDMIERVIAFDAIQVSDVMMPRGDIVAIEKSITLTELLKVFSDAGHSRLPVYRADLDDPIGMVHIRDLVGILADPEQGEIARGEALAEGTILSQLVRPVLYVPPSMPITDLLLAMQARRIHLALVIDEFGGTDGLVTIEDLIEEIVGEIHDEHDEEDGIGLQALSDQTWEANARLPLEELEAETGLKLELEEDEVDTIGGLVFSLVGRVPVRGEVIKHPAGLEFEVLDADPRRIRKIKIKIVRPTEPNRMIPLAAEHR